ncbi:hypothetical protein F0P94_11870 [Adhaeribacter soli]|uniref:Uncharacterized protein n=2 Tax=Adhaeribacter soli TaxID=2607655 RepID=A0A5N1IW79_9BACT|nr:hypothetical protein F0P94_11870 [Adhaeribacter soli]
MNLKSQREVPGAMAKPAGLEYYLLECWNQYADLPDALLLYVDRIKTREEWEKLGFTFEFNKYGQIRKLKIENRYFSFIQASQSNPLEKEAIRTGKRLTSNPLHIAMLLERGCSPSEFVHAIKTEEE